MYIVTTEVAQISAMKVRLTENGAHTIGWIPILSVKGKLYMPNSNSLDANDTASEENAEQRMVRNLHRYDWLIGKEQKKKSKKFGRRELPLWGGIGGPATPYPAE